MLDWIYNLPLVWKIVFWAVAVAVLVLVSWLGIYLNKRFFRRLQKRHSGIHLAFFEKINAALIVIILIVVFLSAFSGAHTVWQTIFGGTAIVSAVLAFAAQDVIKDILAGIMISINKPFEIGDRIVLEDGTAGVVKNITLRHVILEGLDRMHVVVPNSRLNAMQLKNFSFESPLLSVQFRFPVGYDSDMKQVKDVIFDAVKQSPFSKPGGVDKDGKAVFTPVYFIELADSALVMAVTVFFDREEDPEEVINDVNTRVREALIAAGIEIPYNYVNVVTK